MTHHFSKHSHSEVGSQTTGPAVHHWKTFSSDQKVFQFPCHWRVYFAVRKVARGIASELRTLFTQ